MIYTPKKYPFLVYTKITLMVILAFLGTKYISPFFMVVVLLYWIQYTAVLSYLQFKKNSKYEFKSVTEILLNYNIRAPLFIFLAISGIVSYIFYGDRIMGLAGLFLWFVFASNFYYYYTKKWKSILIYSILIVLIYLVI